MSLPVPRPPSWVLLACLNLVSAPALCADAAVAVLDFELNDLTGLPPTPGEIARTASIGPQLEKLLERKHGYRVVAVDTNAVAHANAGFGYLFDHADAAARLGQNLGAQWILVGRLHKPSFLFAYIMAHLVDVRTGQLAGNYVVEVKGRAEQVTPKGVEKLASQIERTIHP
jgi:hypothetical protein